MLKNNKSEQPIPPDPPEPIDYSKIPFYFENLEDIEIEIRIGLISENEESSVELEYSFDNENWEYWGKIEKYIIDPVTYEIIGGGITVNVPANGKLYIRNTENLGYVTFYSSEEGPLSGTKFTFFYCNRKDKYSW